MLYVLNIYPLAADQSVGSVGCCFAIFLEESVVVAGGRRGTVEHSQLCEREAV